MFNTIILIIEVAFFPHLVEAKQEHCKALLHIAAPLHHSIQIIEAFGNYRTSMHLVFACIETDHVQ